MKKSIALIACSCIMLSATAINTFASDFLYVSDGDTTVSHIKKDQASLTAATTVHGDLVIAENNETMAALFNVQNRMAVANIANSQGDSVTVIGDSVTGDQAVQIKTAGDDTTLTLFSSGQ